MKKLMILFLVFAAQVSFAKLNDRQITKCIESDKFTKSVFQDLQVAYDMRIVTAKSFFEVMDKPTTCPQLRINLKELHKTAVSQFRAPKAGFGQPQSGPAGASKPSAQRPTYEPPVANERFNDFETDMDFPPPPVLPESDFEEGFEEFPY